MVDIKEIKHIRAAPFTLMSSSIHAIFAFIAAILFVLLFGSIAALIPGSSMFGFVTVIGLGIIILYPLTAFFWNILIAFVTALLYNLITPKVGGIKLGMEGDEVKSIPVVSVALILACVVTVLTFIMGLYMGLAGSSILSFISGAIPIVGSALVGATNATNATVPTGGLFGAISGIWALFWIILVPIMAFIMSFIGYALFAIFYNIIIPKIGGMKLIFAEAGTAFELTNIPAVPAALAVSVVLAVLGAIYGFISVILSGDIVAAIIALILTAIMWFIMYFIIVALGAIFYNFLQPKIGGIKLELE